VVGQQGAVARGLHGRPDFGGRNPSARALIVGVEPAQGLDGVAEELDSHGPFLAGRPDVEQAAPMGDLAGRLNLQNREVALSVQGVGQSQGIGRGSGLDMQAREHARGGRLEQGLDAGQKERRRRTPGTAAERLQAASSLGRA
jgi:hypothetical protein